MSSYFEIRNKNNQLLHSGYFEKMKDCVADAVKNSKKLTGAQLAGYNMKGANFAGGDFTGADMTGCNLQGVNFAKATVSNMKIDGAGLKFSDFRGATQTQMSKMWLQYQEWCKGLT